MQRAIKPLTVCLNTGQNQFSRPRPKPQTFIYSEGVDRQNGITFAECQYMSCCEQYILLVLSDFSEVNALQTGEDILYKDFYNKRIILAGEKYILRTFTSLGSQTF